MKDMYKPRLPGIMGVARIDKWRCDPRRVHLDSKINSPSTGRASPRLRRLRRSMGSLVPSAAGASEHSPHNNLVPCSRLTLRTGHTYCFLHQGNHYRNLWEGATGSSGSLCMPPCRWIRTQVVLGHSPGKHVSSPLGQGDSVGHPT